MAAADRLLLEVDAQTRARKSACVKAFGHSALCGCLTENLPVLWSFDDYIAITTRTKEQNGYGAMAKDRKAAYDKFAAVRDQCVRQHIK